MRQRVGFRCVCDRIHALVDSVGTHGDVVVGGSSTVIIGDSHTPAPFVPPIPLAIQKSYGQSFSITDSETGTPLAFRDFVATVNGIETTGVTDANGIAHVKTPTPGAKISLHVMFSAPARTLHELAEGAQ